MNLLPKTHQEFSKKDYWESFFKKRGSNKFEWYGEYPELCEYLHKYIKTKDIVLVAGCGNSSLSSDLHDVGYSNITNIDISQVVIRQMLNLHEKMRPSLKFLQMDVSNMSFENELFTVVLDKGTLDALMPDGSADSVSNIHKYFREINRVLKMGGRYICISLLQSHILDVLLDYFPSHNWMFRVVRCLEAEKDYEGDNSLPVFMVICTKFKSLPEQILELNVSTGSKMERIQSAEEFKTLVVNVQQAAFVCASLRHSNVANQDDISFDLFKQGENTPRYTVYVVDLINNSKYGHYAAFIVPQGREVEWMFCTKKGRQHLADITKYNRLAVIITYRGQTYKSLDSIKDELNEVVCQLTPSVVKGKIPFLSLGCDIGTRTIRYQSNSKSSGDYVVEDVSINGSTFRRLFYLSSQWGIQSEAKLKNVKSRKGHLKEVVDHTHVSSKYHVYMSVAIHMANFKKNSSAAIIGLGGGSLCMFLRKFLPDISIIAIDIDEAMLEVANNWFGFKQDDKLKVELIDGIEFLKKSCEIGTKFDVILFDVDNKNPTVGISFPPKEFLDTSVLENVSKCLNDTGYFILNLVLRDTSLRSAFIDILKSKFSLIATFQLNEDLNEIVICSLRQENDFTKKFQDGCTKINNFFNSNKQDDALEIEQLLNDLHIEKNSK